MIHSRALRRPPARKTVAVSAVLAFVLFVGAGCSTKRFVVNRIGNSLTSGASGFETDGDIELVGDALPFSLKLLEMLLAESPKHKGLLLTACKGFAMYSYVYVQQDADRIADTDLARYRIAAKRARKLYLRALGYGLRGLSVSNQGLSEDLLRRPRDAVRGVRKKDVPLLYWSAAALGLAISVSKNDALMIARLPEVDALLERAIALDEEWEDGTLYEFKLVLSGARPTVSVAGMEPMEEAYRRALDLSGGKRASLFVAYAEGVSVKTQNSVQFREQLERALAIDPDEHEKLRLANHVAQRRARWLLSRTADLFLVVEP